MKGMVRGWGDSSTPSYLPRDPAPQFFVSSSLSSNDFIFFRYRRENNRLTTDQSRLQATYREVENQSKFLTEKIARQQVCGSFDYCLRFAILLFSSVNSMCCFCTADNAARQDRKGNNREKTHRRSGKQDGWELSLLFRGVVKIGFALLWPCYYKQRIFRHLTCIVLLFTTVAARVFPPKCAARVFPPKCAVRVFPPLYTACVFLQFSSSLIGRDKLATHKLGTVIFYSTEKLTIIYGSFISG